MVAMDPLISTIIPTYQRPQLLRRAIRSALRQTYPHLQVDVYDNASGDETAAIVAELAKEDARVRYHCHPHNIGAVANFIYGMEHVSTPYFSFLSDDDVLLPEFYETALAGFDQHPDAMFSAGLVMQMSERGEITNVPGTAWSRDGYFSAPDGFFEMVGDNHPTMTGVLFRREIIAACGGFDPELLAGDADFELRAGLRCSCVVSSTPCAIFLYDATSTSARNQALLMSHDWPRIVQNIRHERHTAQPLRRQAATALAHYLRKATFNAGVRFVVQGEFAEARLMAETLRREYELPTKARLLQAASGVCMRVRPAHWLVRRAYHRQHRSWDKHVQALQAQFGEYGAYLKDDSAMTVPARHVQR